jgi:hypothetical protein
VRKELTEDKTHTPTKWEKGKCFKCQEPWQLGHNKICKFKNQVHLIAIEDEESLAQDVIDIADTMEDQTEQPELQISLHALSVTCSKAHTFPLFVLMEDTRLLALIGSGSTSTFIDPTVIEKVGLSVNQTTPEKVTVANGGILWTRGVVSARSYIIQGCHFV